MRKTSIFVKIADFLIRIDLNITSNLRLKKMFTKELNTFFSGFIVEKVRSEEDYVILVDELINSSAIQSFHQSKHYVLFYEKIGKKSLRTYYTISIFQFQLIIQNVLYQLLAQSDGFLLHSSASKVKRKAYIFLGISGAGKSTLVKLLKKVYAPLSDDLSLIRRINGNYYYYQHPFRETHAILKKSYTRIPVGRVFFLLKDNHFFFKEFIRTDKRCQILIQQLISPNKAFVSNAMKFGTNYSKFYLLHFAEEEKGMVELMKHIVIEDQ